MTSDEEDIYWLAVTVLQEAGGEPYEGKLGVAWSIINRCRTKSLRVPEIVLAPWQYSCFNTNSPTRRLVVTRHQGTWNECMRAAEAAYKGLEPDPTHGSTHYLRPDVLPKLPSWYQPKLVRAALGKHRFLQVPF